jgi:transposase
MPAPSEKVNSITSVVDPDLGAVRRFIEGMLARGAIAALITAILALLTRMRDLNTELVRKLASTSRKRPPNEAMRRLQLELPFLRTMAANEGGLGPQLPPQPPKRGPKTRHPHGRPVLPEHLPRVAEVHRVPEAERLCPTCRVELKRIGLRTTEKLDVEPAKFFVKQDQYETCACPKCHRYLRTAPKPDEVVDRGLLGDELLIQAMVDHYDNAVPFERMEATAQQQDVPLCANTLASSVGRLVDLFDPVVRHIREAALSSDYTGLDATRMPVLDPGHPLGIRSGALWLIEGAHRYAFFLYAPTGHDDHLEAQLRGRKLRSVMCDGSATNNCVERAGGQRGGCNAHGRRKLVEALRGGDERAAEGVALYGAIFHVDAESKRLRETLDERFARREKESAPRVDELRVWIDKRRLDVEPKSALGKAVGYLHRQWKRLTAFLRDPTMELTNNEVERDLRRWVLDRKTWLFVGHDESARRAADALTIITTCKKLGVEPRRYLRETLARILAGEKDLAALLPDRYAASSSSGAADLAA